MSNQVFYMHSQPYFRGFNVEDRATVACRIQDGTIQYGLAICTAGDNFSRKKGRAMAEERMNIGYDTCQYSEGFYEKRFNGDEVKALQWFAETILYAVQRNPQRYKNRLGKFEKERTEQLLKAAKNDTIS